MTFDIQTPDTTYGAVALSRLLAQFQGKTNHEGILNSYSTQVQAVSDMLYSLFNDRTLDDAVGTQLDGLGAIVGAAREASDDDDYRLRIRVQIQINKSSGRIEDILSILALLVPLGSTAEIDFFDPLLEDATLLRLLCKETAADAAMIDTAPIPHTFTNAVATGGVVGVASGLVNGLSGFGVRTYNNGVSPHAGQKATALTAVVEALRSGDWSLRALNRNENATTGAVTTLIGYGGRSGDTEPQGAKVFIVDVTSAGLLRITMEKTGPNTVVNSVGAASALNTVRQYDIIVKGDINATMIELYIDGVLNIRSEGIVRAQDVATHLPLCVVGSRFNLAGDPSTAGHVGKIGPIDIVARARTAVEIAASFTHRRTVEVSNLLRLIEGVEAEFDVESLDPLATQSLIDRIAAAVSAAKAAGVRATLTAYTDSEYPFAFDDGGEGFDIGAFVGIVEV